MPPSGLGYTNYTVLVDNLLQTQASGEIYQKKLQHCLLLSSSYLVTDTTTRKGGLDSWSRGFEQLIDAVVELHQSGALEVKTLNAASQSCAECWAVSTSGTWKDVEGGSNRVRRMAELLKALLDENGRTYRGELVYKT